MRPGVPADKFCIGFWVTHLPFMPNLPICSDGADNGREHFATRSTSLMHNMRNPPHPPPGLVNGQWLNIGCFDLWSWSASTLASLFCGDKWIKLQTSQSQGAFWTKNRSKQQRAECVAYFPRYCWGILSMLCLSIHSVLSATLLLWCMPGQKLSSHSLCLKSRNL